MIWTYTFVKSKLQSKDADSLDELEKLAEETDWLWVDCFEPDDEELRTIAELIKEDKIINAIKTKQIFSQYEKINEHVLIPLILISLKEKLKTHPIYVLTNEKTFITIRNEDASKLINNTLKTFQDCIMKVKCETASSFVISRLFHEITNQNLETIMALRNRIDEIEEKALAKPADKKISKTVFKFKREISTLERIFWVQKELMLTIKEGIIPTIQTSEIDRQTLTHAINNVSRELSLISSHNNALDSILRLQDLGMIHRVERVLIYLTLVTIFEHFHDSLGNGLIANLTGICISDF